jgi:lipopolysaccharide/colanic/teichoic acid biosynthesis glycosyltransferase
MVESAVIVGTGHTGFEVGRMLVAHPELGLRPVGLVGRQPRRPERLLPILGDLPELAAVVARRGVRRIIVCFTNARDSDAELVTTLRANRGLPVEVCVVPRMFELAAAIPASCRDDLWGIPVIPLRRCGPRLPDQLVKRGFDLIVGTTLLIVTAPLQLALMIVQLLACGRPVFFRQERITRGDRMTITKFRTVTMGSPGDQWAVSDDQCTRLGRWLRATHLDELPQLLNVVRGQMSLVGPRPERPYYTSRFAKLIRRYEDRHRMRGGMTGWAQVHGLSGDTSIPERVRFDNYYIEHWSLWLDITILARTLAQPLTGAVESIVNRSENTPDALPGAAEAGSAVAVADFTTADNGSTAADGSITADDGSITADDGSITADDGSTAADDGSTAADDGSTAADGSITADDGSITRRTAI